MTATATRASSSSGLSLRLRFDAFELDEADARLTRDGQPVSLAPKPFAVLCALARTPRTLITKNALLDAVWGHRYVSDSVLKTTVSSLRSALDDNPKQPRYIETVSRRGYRFIGAVSTMPANAEPAPLPISPAAVPSVAARSITGRADALERLRGAWQLARAGKSRIVWIAGEPGVGKTTLIEHFTAEIGEGHCALGQCVDQSGAGEPYLPILDALGALCRKDAGVAALIRSIAPTWLVQMPWLSSGEEREALRRELSGSGPSRMLREFGELLERGTENRPLVLVTEDLHWSDPATVQLMDHVARRRGSARLLWLASFRLMEIMGTDHPLASLRHELRLHGLAEEIVLDAFSEQEVADYLGNRMSGLASDETFVRTLHARTEGLPLFVADVVKDLIAHRDVGVEGDSAARLRLASIGIPENLAGIVEQYMQGLTREARTLLEAASACGAEFKLATLAAVLENDIACVGASCAEFARQQRWLNDASPTRTGAAREPRYAFRHALYREVLYNRIGPVARGDFHRKVATVLERERAGGAEVTAAELAFHFEHAHESMQAVRYYAEAAESALVNLSPTQTMSLAERALTLLALTDEGGERNGLEITLLTLRGAAAIQVLGITSTEVKQAFERALSLLDRVPQHPLRGLCLHPLGVSLYMRGELREAGELARRSDALSAATGDRTALLCGCITHGLVQHSRGRPRLAREWLEKALNLYGQLDERASPTISVADPGVLALGLLALDLLHLGLVDEGRARIAAAYSRACELNEPPPQLAALWLEGHFQVRLYNPVRVMELSEQLRALSEEHALIQARVAHLLFRGWAQAQLGDPRAGHLLIREGYELAVRLGIRAWTSEFLGYAAEALAKADDWASARQELDEAMRCADEIGERQYLPQLLLLDARIADGLGKSKRAVEAERQAIVEARVQEAPWLEMIALCALCERQDATAADRESLRGVLEKIVGGDDAPPMVRARALARI